MDTMGRLQAMAGRPPAAAAPEAARPVPLSQGPLPNPPLTQVRLVAAVAAVAELTMGARLVAHYVLGADNHLVEIRVTDPVTRRVVTVSATESLSQLR